MEIYSKTKEYTLLQGNMLDMWEFVENSTIDSIVTDPPWVEIIRLLYYSLKKNGDYNKSLTHYMAISSNATNDNNGY